MSCCCIPISADDTDTADVNYRVDSEYTWQIHTTIDFGSDVTVVLNETMLEPYWTSATVIYE